MRPTTLTTAGYLVSTVSVALLGWAAWPGAEDAGLEARQDPSQRLDVHTVDWATPAP